MGLNETNISLGRIVTRVVKCGIIIAPTLLLSDVRGCS